MADTEYLEKAGAKHDENGNYANEVSLKLDPHGFPLRPQPSDDPMGKWTKIRVFGTSD